MSTSAAAFAREHGFRHVCKLELSGKRLSRMLFVVKMKEQFNVLKKIA